MRTGMTALVTALTVTLASGSAAHAEDPATPSTGTEATAKPDKSKKTCRTIVRSGTRFSTRVCRSQEDWDKDAENMRRYVEDGQNYGYRRDGENSGFGMTGPPR